MTNRNLHWIKWTAYALSMIICYVFQTLPNFPLIFNQKPIFIIPMVVAIAMFEGETAGALYGVLGGLLWDCASGTAFGFNALFLMFIGITVGLLVNYLFRNTLFSVFLFTAVFSVIIELITWFFFYYMVRDTNIIFVFLMIILPAVLYTLLFTAPLYYGVKQIKKKLTFE